METLKTNKESDSEGFFKKKLLKSNSLKIRGLDSYSKNTMKDCLVVSGDSVSLPDVRVKLRDVRFQPRAFVL